MGKKHKHNNRNKQKHVKKFKWKDCIIPQFDPDCPRCHKDDEVCEISDDKPIFYCLRCDIDFACLNEVDTIPLSQLADYPPLWDGGVEEGITDEYKPNPVVEETSEPEGYHVGL